MRLSFTPLPQDDPLHRALAEIGELYTGTNFMTWWDARGFAVDGGDLEAWDPFEREDAELLANFLEEQVLPTYVADRPARFDEHVAGVGKITWAQVRTGILEALKHHPVSGGSRPGTAAGQFSPHAFMLLEVLEDQVAAALGLPTGKSLQTIDRQHLRCAMLRPREHSAFRGTMYQFLFLVWAPGSQRLLWFDLGGSQ